MTTTERRLTPRPNETVIDDLETEVLLVDRENGDRPDQDEGDRSPRRRWSRPNLPLSAIPLATGVIALIGAWIGGTGGGILQLLHLTIGVGWPMSRVLSPARHTHGVHIPLAALSGIAISAIAAQPLIWTATYSDWSVVLVSADLSFLLGAALDRRGPVRSPSSSRPDAIVTAAGLAALVPSVLAIAAVRTIGEDDVDGLGLFRVLPDLYWFSVGLAVVLTISLVASNKKDTWWLAPAVWVAIGHLAPHLAHDRPRFPTTWVHLGFGDYLTATGEGSVITDARFAWPGLFGATGAAFDDLGAPAEEWFVRLWPVAVVAIMAMAVWQLASRSFPQHDRIAPIAASVFVLLSWTGQDYFSPQSVGIMLSLHVYVLVSRGSFGGGGWISRLPLVRHQQASQTSDGPILPDVDRRQASIVALVLAAAAVVTHPLSPVFLILSLFVLSLYGWRAAGGLLIATTTIFVAWFVLASEPWWSTNLADMVEQLSDPLGNVSSSTSERVFESTADRMTVTQTRTRFGLAAIALVMGYTFLCIPKRFASLRPALPATSLAVTAFLVAGLQSYGGEMTLRAYLFAAPWVAIMLARLLVALPKRWDVVAAMGVTAALLPALLVARFGNEVFELTRNGDRELIETMYDEAATDTENYAFAALVFIAPWGDRELVTVPYLATELDPVSDFPQAALDDTARTGRTTVLIPLTEATRQYGVEVQGRDPQWTTELADLIIDRGGRVILENESGQLLVMETTP